MQYLWLGHSQLARCSINAANLCQWFGGRGSGFNRPSASEVVPRIGALLVEGACFAGRLLLIADA